LDFLLAGWTAVALTTWAWLAVTGVMDELRTFGNFEGMHFEE
jgi:hypothetical protein